MTAQCCLCDFKIEKIEDFDEHLDKAHAYIFEPDSAEPDPNVPTAKIKTTAPKTRMDTNEGFSLNAKSIKIELDESAIHSDNDSESLMDDPLADFNSQTNTKYSNSPVSEQEVADQFELVVLHGYKCKECTFVTTELKTLKEHLKKHTPSVTLSPKQALSNITTVPPNKKFKSPVTVAIAESPDQRLKCNACGKSFASRCNLRSHVKVVHLQIKNHVCKICNKAFFKPNNLKAHAKRHQSNDGISTDQNCSISETGHPAGEALFIKEERTSPSHTPEPDSIPDPLGKSVKCTDCGKSFANRKNLRSHVRLVHLNIRNHVCQVCNKAFSKPNTLVEHSKTHKSKSNNTFTEQYSSISDTSHLSVEDLESSQMVTAESFDTSSNTSFINYTSTPVDGEDNSFDVDAISRALSNSLTCLECGKSFASSNTLKCHVKAVHLQIKNHVCKVCNKAFFKPSLLKIHEKTHTSIRALNKILTDAYESFSYTDNNSSTSDTFQSLAENMETAPSIKEERYSPVEISKELIDNSFSSASTALEEIECTPDVASSIHSGESESGEIDQESPETRQKFGCLHCVKRFISKDLLLEHIQRKHLIKKGDVLLPKIKVKSMQNMKYACISAKDGTFVCKDCNKTFEKRFNCIKHIRAVHLGERKYICQHCQKGFFKGKDLRKHINSMHHNLEDQCEECESEINPVEKADGSKSEISEFLIQGDDDTFTCKVCAKKFQKRINCVMHIRALHVEEKKLPIHPGEKLDKSEKKPKVILQIKQPPPQEVKPKPVYPCPLCPLTFPMKGQADDHIKSHSTTCEHCNEEMGHIKILIKHIQNVHTNNKIEFNKKFLTELIPVEVRPVVKKYHCNQCDEKFAKQIKLKSHIDNAHTDYVCEVCHARLANKESFRKHMKCSHGPKKFNCAKCFKGFARKDHLNNHERGCKGATDLMFNNDV